MRTFTGRDHDLAVLRNQFITTRHAELVPAAVLHGMAGIGKTQLARAYAHTYRADYQLGWWAPAATPLEAITSLGQLAVHLGAAADLPAEQLLARLRDILAARRGWLLVFDNATDPADLEPLLPTSGGGHLLITSRNPAWHGVADPVQVGPLALADAARLLRERTGDDDQAAAEVLAAELGQVPLAVEQAAAYAGQQHLSLTDYRQALAQHTNALLARGRPLAYHGTVHATLTLAIERLRNTKPAAVQLLQLCALLACDELPIQMLLSTPDQLPHPLSSATYDPLECEERAGALYQAGLLTVDVGGSARLHRLVQMVVLEGLPDAEHRQLLTQAVAWMAVRFPDPVDPQDPRYWPRCAQLLSHAQALIDRATAIELATDSLVELLTGTGNYLSTRGMFAVARGHHERALSVCQHLYAGDHPVVAWSLNNLAFNLHKLGEFAQARELDEQALVMRQRLYGRDHLQVAWSLNNLGNDLRALGELPKARRLHERALGIFQRIAAGEDHLRVAWSLSNLADDLRELGEVARARELDQQALAICQRLYAGDHPYIAQNLSSLAEDMQALGKVAEARELHEQALAMYRRLYHGDHPDLAGSLANLAADLRALGEAARAGEFDEQAQAMRQRLAMRLSATARVIR